MSYKKGCGLHSNAPEYFDENCLGCHKAEITCLTNELKEAKRDRDHQKKEADENFYCNGEHADLRVKLEAVEKELANCTNGSIETIKKLEAENAALREERGIKPGVCPCCPTCRKVDEIMQADLAAYQKKVEKLCEHWVIQTENAVMWTEKYHKSEASRGRLVEALEKIGQIRCKDSVDAFTIGGIVTAALSEPRSDVYEAMKRAREALKEIATEYGDHCDGAHKYTAERALVKLTAVLGMSEGRS